jgi:hypothetical protein
MVMAVPTRRALAKNSHLHGWSRPMKLARTLLRIPPTSRERIQARTLAM